MWQIEPWFIFQLLVEKMKDPGRVVTLHQESPVLISLSQHRNHFFTLHYGSFVLSLPGASELLELGCWRIHTLNMSVKIVRMYAETRLLSRLHGYKAILWPSNFVNLYNQVSWISELHSLKGQYFGVLFDLRTWCTYFIRKIQEAVPLAGSPISQAWIKN